MSMIRKRQIQRCGKRRFHETDLFYQSNLRISRLNLFLFFYFIILLSYSSFCDITFCSKRNEKCGKMLVRQTNITNFLTMNTEDNQLTQVLNLLNRMDADIRELKKEQAETNKRIDKWDDRYFQLVKDQGNSARTIIIAAASVVVLSPVLGAVADLVTNHFIK